MSPNNLSKLIAKRGRLIERRVDLLRRHQSTAVIERELIRITMRIIRAELREERQPA